MELRIKEIETKGFQSIRGWTFVIICSSNDLCGIGEGGPLYGLGALNDQIKRLLIGEDAFKINKIEQKLRYALLYTGSTQYHLVSAINIALMDLIGKHLNVPVWRLLGGDREEIKLYCTASARVNPGLITPLQLEEKAPWSGVTTDEVETPQYTIHGRVKDLDHLRSRYSIDKLINDVKDCTSRGFTAIKVDLDLPTPYTSGYEVRSGDLSKREIEYLVNLVKEIREIIGNEIDLILDLQWRLNVNSAIRLCRALEPLGIRWIEDPIPAQMAVSNLEELRAVTSRCNVPIGTGENMYTLYQFKDLVNIGITVWTPDVTKTGGISEGRRIVEFASMYDIEVSPHNLASPVGTMANAHVASLSNTLGVMQFLGHKLPFWDNIIKRGKVNVDGGFLKLSDEPGLGIELDLNELGKVLSPLR